MDRPSDRWQRFSTEAVLTVFGLRKETSPVSTETHTATQACTQTNSGVCLHTDLIPLLTLSSAHFERNGSLNSFQVF